MSEKYSPKKGDRVRVALEGVVPGTHDDYFELGEGMDSNAIAPHAKHVVSIEKIKPPVEAFKPGDVVRTKGGGGRGYALTEEGYVDLASGRYYEDGRAFCKDAFTSTYYEKVSLG